MFKLRINRSTLIILSLLFALNSCAPSNTKYDPIDREGGLTKKEIQDSFIKNRTEEKLKQMEQSQEEFAIPRASSMISVAPPPKIQNDKIISFSATDDVPLKDVLIELGRAAKIDVDIDPNIGGGIVISAYNRPLSEVIERIVQLGHLRYSYVNGILHFERDAPYSKTYSVDFLVDSTLWSDVENNITAILGRTITIFNPNDNNPLPKSSFASNKSAGMISIFATNSEHKEIAKFLDEIYQNASAQVLIEAKVVEVDLNKDYETGIDWNLYSKMVQLDTNNDNSTLTGTSAPSLPFKLNILKGTANRALQLQALEKFGIARAISSPRINAMNNQKASLDFTQNLIYFTLAASTSSTPSTSTTTSTTSTLTATKNEVPLGVQLGITPSINLKTSEVTLDIKPKITIDTGQKVKDPTVLQITNPDGSTTNSQANEIPVIATRQMDTIAKVKSGDVLVIGGLMSQSTNDTDTGIPFISKIPLLGNLFKSVSKTTTITETVIFIKATIVNNNNGVPSYDREFHNQFSIDRREYFK